VKTLLWLLLVALALLFPMIGQEGYFTHLAITMLIFSILASSLNLLMGFTGLVSIAHAAFFGIGAYTSALLTLRYGVPFAVALLLGAALTGVVALGLGIPSFRTRGVYYIIVTVAFQLIASEVFDSWYAMTGGGLGLKGIPRPGRAFQSKVGYYYLVLFIAGVVHYGIVWTLRSPVGISLMAIRDNESKAVMMGVNPLRYKVFAFTLASGLAGLAGGLYVHYLGYAHPDFFSFFVSVDLFLAVMLGGAGTVYGPLFGVLVLEGIREVLHEFVALRLLLFGVLLVILIGFLPQGFLPPLTRSMRRWALAGRRGATPTPLRGRAP
jgi:branched-chain amino acid transport system permease protein